MKYHFNRWNYWIQTNVPILSGWIVKLTTKLQLVPRLRMSGAIPLVPLCAFVALRGK